MAFLGGAGAVLLLVLVTRHCCADATQHCSTSDQLTFVKLAQTASQPVPSTAGSLAPLYRFAHSFLHSVQPNAFPQDVVRGVLNSGEVDVPEVVRYEAGYLVCLILAILYLILMPVAGGILACRHCHGNKDQSNQSSMSPWHYWGITMATCLAAITIILLAGVILAFTANNRARENMEPSLNHLQATLRHMDRAFYSISEKMDIVIDEYSVPKADIESKLKGVGEDIGQRIMASSDHMVRKAFLDLSISVRDALESGRNLQTMETLRVAMQDRQMVMENDLQKLKADLQAINQACPSCNIPDQQLEIDADYKEIPSRQRELSKLLPETKFSTLVDQGKRSFNEIPQTCQRQVAPTVKALVENLEETGESLKNSSQQFPSLRSFSELAAELEGQVERYSDDLDYYDYQRWAVAVAFCTVILLIVVLIAIALILGLPALGLPTQYCPTSCLWYAHSEGRLENMAITLLKAAMGLTFIFSWLFIILVFVTLLFGGNAHTLGCRSWRNGELFEFFDQSDELFSSLNLTESNSTDSNTTSVQQLDLNTAEIYTGCKTGKSLFDSMQLQQLFDMGDFLNLTKYMLRFRQNAHNLSVDLGGVELLSAEGKHSIKSFRESGIDTIQYESAKLLLSRPVVKTNLSAFAGQLEKTAQEQSNETTKKSLQSMADKAREVNREAELQRRDARKMTTHVNAMSVISANFKGNIDRAMHSIQLTQEALHKQVPFVVGNVSECMLQKGEACLRLYLDWVRHAILNEVLECGWLAVSLDNIHRSVCENVVDPWNAFWLCLGWCCVFLVPAVVFSFYTAEHLQPVVFTPSEKNASVDPKEKPKKQNTEPNIYVTLTDICKTNQ
ncbi:hypothetical protein AGOR_G00056710 [Albula goreensis]|uniref:Prominin-like protein n=1 Tax=Albula goreensis TaxID=1534307 RepID=A0A8T3DXK5_9TELE|nr:hypothetical protein AGOR_G00056710 [Albula goreensis]